MNIVLIIPASLLDEASALGETMGWGPNNYSIPLSGDGSEPATHWGLNLASAGEDFIAMLESAGQGQMPQTLIDGGFPPEDFAAVIAGLIMATDTPFDDAIEGQGLLVVGVD